MIIAVNVSESQSHSHSLHHLHKITITCLLIPRTCFTSSSPSMSAHSQHSLLVRSTVHIPEPSQTPLYFPVFFLTSDVPVSPPLLFSTAPTVPRIPARDHSYYHCKLSYLDLVTLCFTHLSSPPGYSSVPFNKIPLFDHLPLCLLACVMTEDRTNINR